MFMTEKQAAEVWCPMIRIGVASGAAGASVNTHPEVDGECGCRGSKCAMWRWHHFPGTRVGYCGLAGKPER